MRGKHAETVNQLEEIRRAVPVIALALAIVALIVATVAMDTSKAAQEAAKAERPAVIFAVGQKEYLLKRKLLKDKLGINITEV